MTIYWGNRGHCPECGKFCGDIRGYVNPERGLVRVVGRCAVHGDVELTGQDWSYDEFCGSDEVGGDKESGE